MKYAIYKIDNDGMEPITVMIEGRNKWAMEQLKKAGEKGCALIDKPAPRWSAYIYNLRKFGVSVQTVTERHSGAFSGNHARYILLGEAVIIIVGGM